MITARTSGAARSASAATSPNGAVTASTRARESSSSSVSPSACTMVDTGTGTAPMRIAARYTVTNSGESAMNISTRCSASIPGRAAPGQADDAVVQLVIGHVAGRPGQGGACAVVLRETAVEQVLAGVEQLHRWHGITLLSPADPSRSCRACVAT